MPPADYNEAMLNFALSSYRKDQALYYQIVVQRWLLEDAQVSDCNDYFDQVTQRPDSLPIYFR